MSVIRVVVLMALSAAAMLSCAQPVRRCGPATCMGCCDNNGECQAGVTIVACGIDGALCSTCATGQTCSAGACGMAMGSAGGSAQGGGASAGGDAGGAGGGMAGGSIACASGFTACGETCTIVSSDARNCGACGRACAATEACMSGQCAPVPSSCLPANPSSCPPNFYCDASSNSCRPGCRSNTNCTAGQSCNLATTRCECAAGTNFCGACVPNDTLTACGTQCVNCAAITNASPECTNGACTFTCNPGFHQCGNQCVSNSSPATCGTRCEPCPGGASSTPTCDGTTCGLACAAGFHLCAGACVSDFDAATCGSSCQPCAAPANATASCASTGAGLPPACAFTCNPGFARCGNQCVPESTTQCGATCQMCTAPTNGTNPQCVGGQCQYTCAQGTHQCGTQCLSNTSVNSCGANCAPCPVPMNGTATCDGTACGIQCNTTFHECNGQCVSNLSPATCGSRCAPCPDGPMGSGTTTTCDGVSCGLRCTTPSPPNFCNGVCVADSVTSCGPSCQVCPTPANGTAVCSSGRCDVSCAIGFHRCGTQCVADSAVDSCGTSCTACPSGPVNSVTTCSRSNVTAPYVCGWACAPGSNRCPTNGNQCVPADYVLGCGPTCAVCQSATANERGVCNTNGICGVGCVTSCGGACVNTFTSSTHCGRCNSACQANQRCSVGECRGLCAGGVGFSSLLPAITGNFSSGSPMLVVDVNGDGRPDLVTAEGSSLLVRLGQAGGTFAAAVSTSTNISATTLVAGDLTGDGRPELVAIGASSSAAVLRNSGTGAFTNFLITANPVLSQTPTSVTIGEFNGAAPLDVVFGFNTSVSAQAAIVFPGVAGAPALPLGTGASASIGIGLISNLRAVDLNGDSNSDLVVTAATNALFVFPGTGVLSAPFNTAAAALAQLPPGETFVPLAGTPVPLAVGDVTGDGVADAIVSSVGGAGAFQGRVFPLTAALGIGTSIALPTTGAVRVLPLADFDSDGRLDVGVGAVDLRIFAGQAGGTFAAPLTIGVRINGTSPQSLALVDITQDGRPDLISQNSSTTIVTVPNENGAFPTLQGASVPNADRIVVGDLSGDGLSDVVATTALLAQVLYSNDAGTGFIVGPSFPIRSDRVAIARLDGDPFADLVTIGAGDASVPDAGVTPGRPNYRLVDTTMPTSTTIRGRLEVERNSMWGTVCDDGWDPADSEVACRSLGYPSVGAAFVGSPGPSTLPILMDDVACVGTESELLLCSYNMNHNCVHSEDVGVSCSLIGAAPSGPTVIEVRFGSANGPGNPIQLLTPNPANLVHTGDLDGDGDEDIIASTATTLVWFANLGSSSFGPAQPIVAATTGAASLVVVDLNADGRKDLLTLSSNFGAVTPFINLGGGFVAGTSLSVFASSGTNLVAGDLNNDSKIDFTVNNRVYRGDGAGGFTSPGSTPVLPPRTQLIDLDNDGAPDLVSAGGGSSGLVVLRGDALTATFFTAANSTFSAGAPFADVVPATLNADEQRDLIVLEGDIGSRFVAAVAGTCR